MRTRTLRLAKETLAPLAGDEMSRVVAGTDSHNICWAPTWSPDCWNDISFEHCPTPTLPLEECIF